MGKLLKPGRVVICLAGRFAGKKGIVLTSVAQGNKEKPFGHCLVVGLEKAPKKVHRKMSPKLIAKRVRIRTFVKQMNYQHLLPTRYMVSANEFEAKNVLGAEYFEAKKEDQRQAKKAAKENAAKVLMEKFLNPPEKLKTTKDLVFLRKRLRF
eukprot:Platyproteum_vivax@DN555_c0_g1_i1.p1